MPWWAWLLIGLLGGGVIALVTFVVYLSRIEVFR